jgi:hypothetical protein
VTSEVFYEFLWVLINTNTKVCKHNTFRGMIII